MISVTCTDCQTTFRIADHLGGAMVSCPRCFGHVQAPSAATEDYEGSEAPPPRAEPAPPEPRTPSPADRAAGWHYARGGHRHGPVSERELERLIEQGELKPRDLVWRPGLRDWQPAGRHFHFDRKEDDQHLLSPFDDLEKDNDSAGRTCSSLSCVFGSVAFLFCPLLFGLAGLILGILGVSLSRNKTTGTVGIILSIVGAVVGMMINAALMKELRGLRGFD